MNSEKTPTAAPVERLVSCRYVLGFAFDEEMESVLMVEKQHGPAINIGKLNGIGGKVEGGESMDAAMVREFKEETGCWAQWTRIGRMSGDGWELDIFSGPIEGDEPKDVNDVGERIQWEDLTSVMNPCYRRYYAQNVPTMVVHAVIGDGELDIEVGN